MSTIIKVPLKGGTVHSLRITDEQERIYNQHLVTEGQASADHIARLWYNSKKKVNKAKREQKKEAHTTSVDYSRCAKRGQCYACSDHNCPLRTMEEDNEN